MTDAELTKEFPAVKLGLTREDLINMCEGYEEPELVKMLIEKMSDDDMEALLDSASSGVYTEFWNGVMTTLGVKLAKYKESKP